MSYFPLLTSTQNKNYTNLMGSANYSDVATGITPLTITQNIPQILITDGLGASTTEKYLPSGIRNLFDSSNNRIQLTGLTEGSTVLVRNDLDFSPISGGPYCTIEYKFYKNSIYTFSLIKLIEDLKNQAPQRNRFIVDQVFYVGDIILNGEVEVSFTSDRSGNLIVNGVSIYAWLK